MQIRTARLEDLPAIVDIYNVTIPSRVVTADLEPIPTEQRVGWFHAHTPESRPLWVVEDEGQIIAWLSFQSFYGRPAYRHTAEISIYLAPEAQGQGLGSQLLEYAIQVCPGLEIKTLLGFIFGHNIPSIRLFEKYGFSTWGHFPRIAVLDGIERDLLILGKRVAE